MSDVRMPIETICDGNKITKICVEDVYKIINRVYEAMDKAYNKSSDILEKIDKSYQPTDTDDYYYEGSLIIGTGVSEPCDGDLFDVAIGNDIAFMKSKLNANIKKHNFLKRIINNYEKLLEVLNKEIDITDYYIAKDLDGIREYNPYYLADLKLK